MVPSAGDGDAPGHPQPGILPWSPPTRCPLGWDSLCAEQLDPNLPAVGQRLRSSKANGASSPAGPLLEGRSPGTSSGPNPPSSSPVPQFPHCGWLMQHGALHIRASPRELGRRPRAAAAAPRARSLLTARLISGTHRNAMARSGAGRKRLVLQDTPHGPGPCSPPRRPHPSQTSRSVLPQHTPGRISSLPRAEPWLKTSIVPCLSFPSRSDGIEYPHPWGSPAWDGGQSLCGGIIPDTPCSVSPLWHVSIPYLLDINPAYPRTKPLGEALDRSRPPSGCKIMPWCPHATVSPSPAVPTPPSSPDPRQVLGAAVGICFSGRNLAAGDRVETWGVIFLVNGIVPVFIIKTSAKVPGTQRG